MQDAMHNDMRRFIARELFNVPDCPDSVEPGRACRYCEADWLARAILQKPETR